MHKQDPSELLKTLEKFASDLAAFENTDNHVSSDQRAARVSSIESLKMGKQKAGNPQEDTGGQNSEGQTIHAIEDFSSQSRQNQGGEKK